MGELVVMLLLVAFIAINLSSLGSRDHIGNGARRAAMRKAKKRQKEQDRS